MELLIIKNGRDVIARSVDPSENGVYSLLEVESIPEYPSDIEPGFGKSWELVYENEELIWKAVDRELTIAEKVEAFDDAVNGLKILGVE